MTKQPLAIGIENYKEIIEKNYYYIDKSCMIKDLIEEQGKVNLFTRPRRFGKTLALSMIRTFFEKEYADDLTNEGYEKILKYGICFCQKSCCVFI